MVNRFLWMVLVGVLTTGCSVRRFAVNQVGNALAGGGSTFAADDDPELIRAAVPFSLKLMESLLTESPRHRGLLEATASGFTQYGYAFIQLDADEVETEDVARAMAMKERARRMYLRARDYGVRGLETRYRDFGAVLRRDPRTAVARVKRKDDVPLLYWTAAAWGAAIGLSKNQPDLVAEQPVVEALIDRALALDERYDRGAIHGFLITYELVRPGGSKDAVARARKHFERAVELSGGQAAGPYVTWAEQVCVQEQNKPEFVAMLERALAIDPHRQTETRLVNLIMQQRARWLLSRVDELFLEE